MYFWSKQSVLCVCPFFTLMMLDQVNLFSKMREITVLNSEKTNPSALRQMTVNSKVLKRPRNTQKMDLFTKYSKMCKSQISLKRAFNFTFWYKTSIPSPFLLTQSARKLCGKPFVFFWIGFLILLNIRTGLLPARGKPSAYLTLAKTSAIPKSTWK